MATTPKEKELLREVIAKAIAGDKSWLKDQCIFCFSKSGYWLLKYSPGPMNDYNKLCRGMVVAQPELPFDGDPLDLIVSFPFVRFFNQHQPEADVVDLSNADMLDKLDGTFVGVFLKGNLEPIWHTHRLISSHAPDMAKTIIGFSGKEFNLMKLIGSYVKHLAFTEKDLPYTYIFEMIHDYTKVVTKYDPKHYGLYLIGGRNIRTHEELTEKQLDQLYPIINSKRATIRNSDYGQISKMYAEMQAEFPDFEGFIFRDRKTGKRIKVKDPEYVKKHHNIIVPTYKNLLIALLNEEQGEILAYNPTLKVKFDKIKLACDEFADKMVLKVKDIKAKGVSDKQSLQLYLFGKQMSPRWERRLNHMKGIKSDKIPAQEDISRDRNIIFGVFNFDNDEQIRNYVQNYIKMLAIGDPKSKNEPETGKAITMLGLDDMEEDSGVLND